MKTLVIAFCICCSYLHSAESPGSQSNRVLFLMQAGHIDQAINLYHSYATQRGQHDFELLRNVGMSLLDQGARSDEPEVQLLTLFGAGISMNESALYIMEDGLRNKNPILQMISMNMLSQFQNDEADQALNRALNSPIMLLRLQGIYHLAKKKAPNAVPQAEALMCKVDQQFWSVFPEVYGMVGNAQAMRIMKKLLSNLHESVRIATILSAAQFGRDDLLPSIRILATHHSIAQQEACAAALGILKDETSVKKLETIASSGTITKRLAALQALYRLGRKEAKNPVEKAAKENDLFAIAILGEMEGSEEVLFELTKSPNTHVKTNAALSLLKLKDARCLRPLCEILITDERDLAIEVVSSPGGALSAFKIIPSAQQNLEEDSAAHEMSLALREEFLIAATDLPEKDFLILAHTLFEARQNDLVPVLVETLENMRTPGALALLKKHQQKAGAPLIRNYCNLALYRLKEEGPYSDNLHAWIAKEQGGELIHFRPLLTLGMTDKVSSVSASVHQLTPEETSRLLIESFEAMIQNQDDIAVDVLLHAIQYGNAKNRYALAGLLIFAAQ